MPGSPRPPDTHRVRDHHDHSGRTRRLRPAVTAHAADPADSLIPTLPRPKTCQMLEAGHEHFRDRAPSGPRACHYRCVRWEEVVAREPNTPLGHALTAAAPLGDGDDGRVFLRTGATVSAELRVVDEPAIEWFELNDFVLAWELHSLSGLPLAFVVPAEYDEFLELGFLAAAVELPTGAWLDVHGVRDAASVTGSFAWLTSGGVSQSRFDLHNPEHVDLLIGSLSYMPGSSVEVKLANTYPALEREVIRDFARVFLGRAGIPPRRVLS